MTCTTDILFVAAVITHNTLLRELQHHEGTKPVNLNSVDRLRKCGPLDRLVQQVNWIVSGDSLGLRRLPNDQYIAATKASPDRSDGAGSDAQTASAGLAVSYFSDTVARVEKNHDRLLTKSMLVYSRKHESNVFVLMVPMVCDLDRADTGIEVRDPPDILGIAASNQLAFLNKELLHPHKNFVLAGALGPRIEFISIPLSIWDEHGRVNHGTRADAVRGL
jgi:hypothetical protein